MAVDPATMAAAGAAAGGASGAPAAGAGGAAAGAGLPTGGGSAPGMDMVNGPLNMKSLGTPVNPTQPQGSSLFNPSQSHSTMPHYPGGGAPPQAQPQDPAWGNMVGNSLLGDRFGRGPQQSDAMNDRPGELPRTPATPEPAQPERPTDRANRETRDFFGPQTPTPNREAPSHEDRAIEDPAQHGTRTPVPPGPTGQDRAETDPRPTDPSRTPTQAPRNESRANQPTPDAPRQPDDHSTTPFTPTPYPTFSNPPAHPGPHFDPIPEPQGDPDDDWYGQIHRAANESSDPNDKRAFLQAVSQFMPEASDFVDVLNLLSEMREGKVSESSVVAAMLPVVSKGNIRTGGAIYLRLRKNKLVAEVEGWSRNKLRNAERRILREYSERKVKAKLHGKGPFDVVYETSSGTLGTYAATVGLPGKEAHHLVPQSLFWHGPVDTAALADYVPCYPLDKAVHTGARTTMKYKGREIDAGSLHTFLNEELRSAGLFGKKNYTRAELAHAIDISENYYKETGLPFMAEAVAQFRADVFNKVK